jgi:chromosome segregation ATPase
MPHTLLTAVVQRFGRSIVTDQPEVTEVMESLVADNEALKRDIAELQNLLAESREDMRTLREEMEEARVHVLPTNKGYFVVLLAVSVR